MVDGMDGAPPGDQLSDEEEREYAPDEEDDDEGDGPEASATPNASDLTADNVSLLRSILSRASAPNAPFDMSQIPNPMMDVEAYDILGDDDEDEIDT
jgi:hypothetical protein